jgi:hypothetical protein
MLISSQTCLQTFHNFSSVTILTLPLVVVQFRNNEVRYLDTTCVIFIFLTIFLGSTSIWTSNVKSSKRSSLFSFTSYNSLRISYVIQHIRLLVLACTTVTVQSGPCKSRISFLFLYAFTLNFSLFTFLKNCPQRQSDHTVNGNRRFSVARMSVCVTRGHSIVFSCHFLL